MVEAKYSAEVGNVQADSSVFYCAAAIGDGTLITDACYTYSGGITWSFYTISFSLMTVDVVSNGRQRSIVIGIVIALGTTND